MDEIMSSRIQLMKSEIDQQKKMTVNESSFEFNTLVIKNKSSLVKAKITDRIYF